MYLAGGIGEEVISGTVRHRRAHNVGVHNFQG
jgi:hypothetical protein